MKKKVTMARPDIFQQTLCPVARAESVAGGIWTALVLRELFGGSHRFDEIQVMTGATPQMLATRLKKLEADGLVERRQYSKRPPRYEYHLTEMGADFFPVLMALRAWGEKWLRLPGEEPSIQYTHTTCGQSAGFGPLCQHCGQLIRKEDLARTLSSAAAAEREARRLAAKES